MFCKVITPSNEIFKLPSFPETFQELTTVIGAKLGKAILENMTLKYLDNEQEYVSLKSEEDFQTAVISLESEHINTLKICMQQTKDSSCLLMKNVHSFGHSTSLGQKQNIKGLFSGMRKLKSEGGQEVDLTQSAPLLGAKNKKVESSNEACVCSECNGQISGVKYICLECSDYKCCEVCEAKAEHMHSLLKVRNSIINNKSMFEENKQEVKRSPGQRLSFVKSAGERKSIFAGQASLEDFPDQQIKTYPFEEEKVAVSVKNTGTETWPTGVRLSCVNGIYMNREECLLPLGPGESQTVAFYLRAPMKVDKYLSQWKLFYREEGKLKSFGESLFIETLVEERKTLSPRPSIPVRSNRKVSTNLIKRAKTLTEAFLSRAEKLGQRGVSDNRLQVAEWMSVVFAGELEEKLEFLNDCAYNGEEEDLQRVIELYLESLCKGRTESKNKAESGFQEENQHICAISA